jgi:hypothetical protein
MKISGVFTIVLVATASPAAAQPLPKEDTGRVSYRHQKSSHRDERPRDGDWVQLASPTPASHGTEFVVIGKEQGEFNRVRIDPAQGRVIVRRVRIYFDDGKQKVVDVDKIIDVHRNNPAIIDLDTAKAIDRIVVTTEPQTKGSYAIYAAVGTGEVVGER